MLECELSINLLLLSDPSLEVRHYIYALFSLRNYLAEENT